MKLGYFLLTLLLRLGELLLKLGYFLLTLLLRLRELLLKLGRFLLTLLLRLGELLLKLGRFLLALLLRLRELLLKLGRFPLTLLLRLRELLLKLGRFLLALLLRLDELLLKLRCFLPTLLPLAQEPTESPDHQSGDRRRCQPACNRSRLRSPRQFDHGAAGRGPRDAPGADRRRQRRRHRLAQRGPEQPAQHQHILLQIAPQFLRRGIAGEPGLDLARLGRRQFAIHIGHQVFAQLCPVHVRRSRPKAASPRAPRRPAGRAIARSRPGAPAPAGS